MIKKGRLMSFVFCLNFLRSLMSKYIYTMIARVVRVRIALASFGNRKPSTVLRNTGFINGGIIAETVRIKKEIGQNKCVSARKINFLNLDVNFICLAVKKFFKK